jgi:hypothetical protein
VREAVCFVKEKTYLLLSPIMHDIKHVSLSLSSYNHEFAVNPDSELGKRPHVIQTSRSGSVEESQHAFTMSLTTFPI